METCNTAQIKMGLKILASNAHSAEAGILPSAAWRLVWALGTMKDENDNVLVAGLSESGKKSLNFQEMRVGYTGEDNMTIIPAEAYCKMNVALADGQSAEDVCTIIRAHLDSRGFEDVNVCLA